MAFVKKKKKKRRKIFIRKAVGGSPTRAPVLAFVRGGQPCTPSLHLAPRRGRVCAREAGAVKQRGMNETIIS